MNLFKKKEADDWMLLHALRGQWSVDNGHGKYDDYCNYEIMYSPSEDKVKINMSGYKPSGHTLYEKAMRIVGYYNQAILENTSFNELKEKIDKQLDTKKEKK